MLPWQQSGKTKTKQINQKRQVPKLLKLEGKKRKEKKYNLKKAQ